MDIYKTMEYLSDMNKSQAIEILETMKKYNFDTADRLHYHPQFQGKRTVPEIENMAINIALDSLIKERPKGEWIPVSEKLPEERVAVLIWCPERKNIYCAYFEEKQWWIFGAGWEKVTLDVTAWMPLPEPYKAESEVEE